MFKNNLQYRFTQIFLVFIIASINLCIGTDKYRFVIDVSNSGEGEPVIANIDFPRWLYLDNNRNPVNQRSVKVYTIPKYQEVQSVIDSNLGSIAYHYENEPSVRFRAVEGINQYAIEFQTADKFTHALPPDFYQLGIGETIRYNYSQSSYVWGGWSGGVPIVADADDDGDWDLYLRAFDGEEFIVRNIGSNKNPLFLPPARYTEYDKRVQPLTQPYYIDWNGNGQPDRLTFTAYDDGYTEGAVKPNRSAYLEIEFNNNGFYSSKKRIIDDSGQDIILERAVWVNLAVMDVNNNGRSDILACGASNYIVALVNKGMNGDKPLAQRILLPISGDDGNGFTNNHQIEDMSLKFTVVDWNRNGYEDVLISGWNNSARLLENAAINNEIKFKTPVHFKQYGGSISAGDCAAPAMLDWNNNGKLDIIVTGATGQILYCENIGTRQSPEFAGAEYMRGADGKIITINAESTNGTIQGSEETYWGYLTVTPCDWDNDGTIDLITNDSLGRLSWMENVGTKENGLLSGELRRFKENFDTESGLYSHWKLDGNFNDSVGSSNLTSVGSAGFPEYSTQGYYDGCYIFENQTAGYTNCLLSQVSISQQEAFTITAWVKPTDLQDGFSDTSPHTIVKLLGTSDGSLLDIRIRDGKLDVYYTNPVINFLTNVDVNINEWNFIAVTYYRNVIKIFINGKIAYHRGTNGGQSYDRIYIGSSSPTIRGFNGKIDDVRLYKRELIDLDVAKLYDKNFQDNRIATPWRNRPAVADINGDGKDNIIVLESSGRLVVYGKIDNEDSELLQRLDWIRDENGEPIIVCPFYANQLGRTQLNAEDWNGNSLVDIMYGQDWGMLGFDSSLGYLKNVGTATNPVFRKSKLQARGKNFVEWTGHNGKHNGHSPHPLMVDFNDDGKMDLLVGTESGRITYYSNDYFDGTSFPHATVNKFEKMTANGWLELSQN